MTWLILALIPGAHAQQFTEIGSAAGIAYAGNAGGSTVADFNDDGYPDILLLTASNDGSTNTPRLFFNDGDGTFTDVTVTNAALLITGGDRDRSAVAADLDNDGDIDFVINTDGGASVYENAGSVGSYQFTRAWNSGVGNWESMGLIDVDNDGYLDVVTDAGDYLSNPGNGGLAFGVPADAESDLGLPDPSVADFTATGDWNRDGYVDFLIRTETDDQENTGDFDLYTNQGDGSFTGGGLGLVAANGAKGSSAFCDIDNDLSHEIWWSRGSDGGSNTRPNQFFDQSNGTFTNTNEPGHPYSDDITGFVCNDFDNDGWLDAIVANDDISLYWNNGDGSFLSGASTGLTLGNTAQSILAADFDLDGDVDLFVNKAGANALFQNNHDSDDYLVVRALRQVGTCPSPVYRDDLGAQATLHDFSNVDTTLVGIREVNGGKGHGAQDYHNLHIGLPPVAAPYYLGVQFPQNGGLVYLKVDPDNDFGNSEYHLYEVRSDDWDADGLLNADEIAAAEQAGYDSSTFLDADIDGDGLDPWADDDSDGDGLTDNEEDDGDPCTEPSDILNDGIADFLQADRDGDGSDDGVDCDPDDDQVFPTTWYQDADFDTYGDPNVSQDDTCDPGVGWTRNSEDCDDNVTDGILYNPETPWYPDADGDTYGDSSASPTTQCEPPGNDYVLDNTDCDDTVGSGAAINPETEWYEDADGDGYGDPGSSPITQCASPGAGYAPNNTDCDDTVGSGAAFNPETEWYPDVDGDLYGDGSENPVVQCDSPGAGYVANGEDCDDNDTDGELYNPETEWYPDVDEDGFGDPLGSPVVQCDSPGVDYSLDMSDCDDNATDGDLYTPFTEWYPDLDGDLYGDANMAPTVQCESPGNDYVLDNSDCDDNTTDGQLYNPDSEWYPDVDADGFGALDADATIGCEPPSQTHVLDNTDCNDTLSGGAINPAADEICDNIDNNCDNEVDDDDTDDLDPQLQTDWYPDDDSDDYGDEDAAVVTSCFAPPNHIDNNTDCDDDDNNTYPGAPELCDNLDNDCSGQAEQPNEITYVDFYVDADGDGFGDDTITPVNDCKPPNDGQTYVQKPGDCDDDDDERNDGEDETCDGVDEDCDGTVDNAPIDGDTYYLDDDGDGYGDASSSLVACDLPSGYVDNPDDCNDLAAAVNPGELESCNGQDDDCDTLVDNNPIDGMDYWPDSDGDGAGDVFSAPLAACSPPPDTVSNDDDCNDLDDTVYTGAPELCDNQDNDCDGNVETESEIVYSDYYRDADDDGYGLASDTQNDCTPPDGYTASDGDCNDLNPNINPGADEIWYDGDDQDCDGANDFDQDADGFECDPTVDSNCTGNDCDDVDPAVNPDAADDTADGTDQDCDGTDGPADGPSDRPWDADEAPDWYTDGETVPLAQPGCACSTGSSGGMPLVGLLLALVAVRRRSR